MLYRWILHDTRKPTQRGTTLPAADVPAEGQTLHLISTDGSMAIMGSHVFINGRPASPGEYRIEFENGTLVLVVGDEGSFLGRREEVNVDG